MKTPSIARGSSLVLCLAALTSAACASPAATQTQAIPTTALSTPDPTATFALPAPPNTQPTPNTPQAVDESEAFPLSNPGPYQVGVRKFAFEDPGRDNRPVRISVWYPALETAGSTGTGPTLDAAVDDRGAPYPLLLSSSSVANQFARYLVSHGFAWASVDSIDTYEVMRNQMFDQPLDLLFALNQAASNSFEGLGGMIDAEHAGAIGYSFDGYNALVLSGARIDPRYYLSQCPSPDPTTQAILSGLSSFNCVPAGDWRQFAAQAGEAITGSNDGLWQPISDPRIRAVMPLAAEGWWVFGEYGLAAVDRPALMITATEDPLYPENALIFEHLGTPDKAMISFVGPGHLMIYNSKMVGRMAHFAAAFFGYHLQGKESLEYYFSEEWVTRHDDLKWGVQPPG